MIDPPGRAVQHKGRPTQTGPITMRTAFRMPCFRGRTSPQSRGQGPTGLVSLTNAVYLQVLVFVRFKPVFSVPRCFRWNGTLREHSVKTSALTLTLSPGEREPPAGVPRSSKVVAAHPVAGGCVRRRNILPRLGERVRVRAGLHPSFPTLHLQSFHRKQRGTVFSTG